ncbi:group-specific protein [Bacillus suaedaesalsae]|uniref:Group-specific protein n=1 Tax=Bacillus suaedaesalsae TaxID=2810349 RepID=A0ABS2DHS1_9BACI|nr:group-specific protein [Bacillus suaedaesalsae]MBM6618036.1 group-specific protein [Bacillus suaedaesalsae]
MSCKLDHSLEDVTKKLEEQKTFLPVGLYTKCMNFLSQSPSQLQLNELFHLLKKYDLASDDEKLVRNGKLTELV